jgi:CRISPR type III-A-associated RAMP protein Csm4
LSYLADSGIGTDRTVGMGQFSFSFDTFSIDLPEKTSHSFNLSLFCPENHGQLKELIDNNSKYDLIKRGGWIGEPYNTFRKKSIYMFREGSVFKTNDLTAGKTVDLKPEKTPAKIDHPVYRVGKSLFMPVLINES